MLNEILQVGAVVMMSATAYGIGCDAPGPHTKIGTRPTPRWTVAADPDVLPLGAVVHVAGLGPRRVEDVGGGIKGLELDLFMDDCEAAREWGRQQRAVAVLWLPGTASATDVMGSGLDRMIHWDPAQPPPVAEAVQRRLTAHEALLISLLGAALLLALAASAAAVYAIMRTDPNLGRLVGGYCRPKRT